MIDPSAPIAQGEADARRWLLLVHQLPPKPDYLRVKIRRRLRRLGAVALKHTVYLLPNSDEALEDFHWLREEIEAEGGSAVIAEAAFIEGVTDEEIEAMLQAEGTPATGAIEAQAISVDTVASGRTWVTRQDVHVDRIASAWLIKRFIDPAPKFKFVAARGYRPRPAELRFDMFQAEYTHVGADCTFQTLVRRFGLDDVALKAISEIVHDIDCKDELFARPETAGVARLVGGIASAHDDDNTRIERGGAVLDDLYAAFSRRRS